MGGNHERLSCFFCDDAGLFALGSEDGAQLFLSVNNRAWLRNLVVCSTRWRALPVPTMAVHRVVIFGFAWLELLYSRKASVRMGFALTFC